MHRAILILSISLACSGAGRMRLAQAHQVLRRADSDGAVAFEPYLRGRPGGGPGYGFGPVGIRRRSSTRPAPHEVGTYAYHRWTGAPTEMVQEKLVRLLQGSRENSAR